MQQSAYYLYGEYDKGIYYPSSDGKPIADNTTQARWIIMLYNNLRALFDGQEVFVAADLLWYPVEGNPRISIAPDVMVAFGRPGGERLSYQQWLEGGLCPQVVFEIFSPSNSYIEISRKQQLYHKYGVEEFIVIDPAMSEAGEDGFVIYERREGQLLAPDFSPADWTSPRLGVRFRLEKGKLMLYLPDGSPFKSFTEVREELAAERRRAEEEKKRAEEALAEVERLRARLRELGE
jgi:Uma2 family endonuclease